MLGPQTQHKGTVYGDDFFFFLLRCAADRSTPWSLVVYYQL
jgi:hypothetical protein